MEPDRKVMPPTESIHRNCQEEHSGVEYLNYINALGICYEMRMHAAVIDRQVIYVGYYVVRVKYLKRNDKKPEWLSY